MRTTLVTGGIGSGKSEVCRYLSSKGYPVYDCDSRCKALYGSVRGLKERIEKELGISFDSLGGIFQDVRKIELLESIVFPVLLDDFERWRSGLESERCFIESATALSKPAFDGVYDEVWIVTADYDLRAGRNPKVAERDGFQHFDLSKAAAVISNNGSLTELYDKIDRIL